MPRVHWTIPEALARAIEAEAERRMRDNHIKTRQTLGTVGRDIAITCIILSLGKVKGMSMKEIDEALKKAEQIAVS